MDDYVDYLWISSGRNAGFRGAIAMQVNMFEAKTNLSNLVKLIETGKESMIIIARYGKPIVKMTAYQEKPASARIGVAKGKLKSPKDLDQHNDEIAVLFGGGL